MCVVLLLLMANIGQAAILLPMGHCRIDWNLRSNIYKTGGCLNSKTISAVFLMAVMAILVACGGGDLLPTASIAATNSNPFAGAVVVTDAIQNPAAQALKKKILAAPTAVTAAATTSTLTPFEFGAEMLLDFGESQFPQYFPTHEVSQTWEMFRFRYYPKTGVYLGVVVVANADFTLAGVYVKGGEFGNVPLYVGQMTVYVNPKTLVYSYWGRTAMYPELTTLDGKFVRVVNKTQWTDKDWGLLSCWAADKQQPDGTIPQACFDRWNPVMHMNLYIDPKTNELHEYAVAPTNVTWVRTSYDPSRIPAAHPDWTTVAQLPNGDQVFVRQDSTSVLRLLTAAGVESVVYGGNYATDYTCRLVMSYTYY